MAGCDGADAAATSDGGAVWEVAVGVAGIVSAVDSRSGAAAVGADEASAVGATSPWAWVSAKVLIPPDSAGRGGPLGGKSGRITG